MCTLKHFDFYSIPKSIIGDRNTWTLDDLNTEDFYKVMQFSSTPEALVTDEPYLDRQIIRRFRDYVNMMQEFSEPVTLIGYPTDDNGKLNAYVD